MTNRSHEGSRDLRGTGPLGAVPAGLTEPATLGVAIAFLAYVSAFASITDVVGGTARLAAVVAVAAVCGAALARVVSPRTAVRLAVALFGAGLFGYYLAIPGSRVAIGSLGAVALDVVSLLTGLSVLRLALVDVWVLVIAPVPTFLVAYLAGRARHVAAATVAGGTLGFFVLTGDAGDAVTLAGVVGVAVAVGLSTVSVPGGLRSHGGTLAAVLAVMVLASATVTVLPAGAAQPWAVDRGAPGIESTLVADDELEIVGTTRLSPEVRFTMESPVERNWHVASYDTYTGDGWVRSGEERPLEAPLSGPPGDARAVESTFTTETEMETIPAPWQAVDVGGVVGGAAQVDDRGTIRPGGPILEGDQVAVESRVLDASPAELRNASTDYDPTIEERYTQLPESTPDRVGERTAEVLAEADAENPYDEAAAIESYLIEEYDYSLTIDRPEGDIADAFLFEMTAGYCTYFATTMVAMLRSQGVPAKLATGYSSGQQVDTDEYVVRGQDAHAWVMVYFPEHGWVEFDPTPSAERNLARDIRLAEARSDGAENVDTDRSGFEISTNVEEEPNQLPEANASGNETTAGNDTESGLNGSSSTVNDSVPEELRPDAPSTVGAPDGDGGPSLPSREVLGYWLLFVVVATAGARHVGATDRAYHAARLRLPSRSRTPRADAERAFADLERILARRYRERRPGETPRAYLDGLRARGVDDRVHAIGEVYERAAYAGDVSREDADAARRTVRRLALESTPLLGRLFDRK
ncbi:Transglutaminase-like enzyme, putative cysteine protease [Halorubrum aquaticum]|uniref:Transglutaminase-like enzyme, putative cysteine protease n=1 Tax=Halorubrum aquaticum TaxID=387340 RepID=A0A1I3BNX7_9EURY|nr:transglutaminase domain-containing protein [Halorubrum aquaticum]SFH63796.1 Transglutaminase-like enzyme, putative cysteine protease [Halorubrum aquaticum]